MQSERQTNMPANRIEELIHEATEAKCKFRLSPPALREFANTLLTEYAESVGMSVLRELPATAHREKLLVDFLLTKELLRYGVS
jgi:hypothetical protein|tara:strand:- start:185 stop:436 length:252 start_codon:yes stop_codon:yes gene_type:complete